MLLSVKTSPLQSRAFFHGVKNATQCCKLLSSIIFRSVKLMANIVQYIALFAFILPYLMSFAVSFPFAIKKLMKLKVNAAESCEKLFTSQTHMFLSTNGSQIPWKVSRCLLSFFVETESTYGSMVRSMYFRSRLRMTHESRRF